LVVAVWKEVSHLETKRIDDTGVLTADSTDQESPAVLTLFDVQVWGVAIIMGRTEGSIEAVVLFDALQPLQDPIHGPHLASS
jgi:hypothetical protein